MTESSSRIQAEIVRVRQEHSDKDFRGGGHLAFVALVGALATTMPPAQLRIVAEAALELLSAQSRTDARARRLRPVAQKLLRCLEAPDTRRAL